MQKALKRTLSLLLVVLMAFGSAAAAFARESAADAAHCQTDYTVSGANALGTILADALDGAEADPNEPYLIRDVSVQGSSVTVVFQNEAACDVVAAAYDESTMRMLCSAVQAVDAHAGEATLTLADLTADSIVIKAFLLGEKHQALCKSYTFLDLTTAYQEFFAKDTDDFDADKVVNLDADKASNFLVLSDDAHRAAPNGTKDKLLTADYDRNVYTFGGATAAITGLTAGDLFYYNDAGMENVVILRVSSVTVAPDGTATVTGEPVGMEEAFSFVHIDTTTDGCDFEADTSDMDAGVTLLDDENGGAKKAPRKLPSVDFAAKPWVKPFKVKEDGIDGLLKFTALAHFQLFFAGILNVEKVAFLLDMNLSAELTISGSVSVQKQLAQFRAMTEVGVVIGIKPIFVFKMSAECHVDASFDFAVGFMYTPGTGFINTSGADVPTFSGIELDGKASVGIILQPYAALLHERLLRLELSGEVDLEVEGKMRLLSPEEDTRVRHACGDRCVDGDFTVICSVGAKLIFAEKTPLERVKSGNIPPFRWHVGDFYCSLAFDEFDWGTCPHRLVRVDFWVKKKDTASGIAGAVIHTGVTEEAAITYNNGSADVATDAGGWATYYFPIADVAYIPKVTASGYKEAYTKEIHVYFDKEKEDYIVNGTTAQVQIEVELEETGLIEFGSYPQSEVKDPDLIAALNAQPQEWVSYGYYIGSYGSGSGWSSIANGRMSAADYMQYCDITYSGQRYRGVTFSYYRPDRICYELVPDPDWPVQKMNGYYPNQKYWFKYEPLQWRVLDAAAGLVLCETIIDNQPYHNFILYATYLDDDGETRVFLDENGNDIYWGNAAKTHYPNNYAKSSLRHWLNADFYNTAFTVEQTEKIVPTLLDNRAYNPALSAYDSMPTTDKVFLLSWNDAVNPAYGFSSDWRQEDPARQAKPSDYAKCQGLFTMSLYNGSTGWIFRSPGDRSECICGVCAPGKAATYNDYNDYETDCLHGIRPAICLNPQVIKAIKAQTETPAVPRVSAQAAATMHLQAGQTCTAAASGAVAGNEYVLLARTAGAAALTPDTTLYIDQQTASGSTVSFTYVPRTGGDALVEIIGDFGSGIETRTVTSSDTPAGKLHAVTANDLTLIYKKDGKIEPVVTADSGIAYTLTFTSSNPKVAAVDDSGNVKTLKKGTAEITVTAADVSGNTAECTCRVTVKYAWWQWLIRILLLGFIWY